MCSTKYWAFPLSFQEHWTVKTTFHNGDIIKTNILWIPRILFQISYNFLPVTYSTKLQWQNNKFCNWIILSCLAWNKTAWIHYCQCLNWVRSTAVTDVNLSYVILSILANTRLYVILWTRLDLQTLSFKNTWVQVGDSWMGGKICEHQPAHPKLMLNIWISNRKWSELTEITANCEETWISTKV
jgi:hypothetical protein